MTCIICNKEIDSGSYGSTTNGLVHKTCYEKEHEGQRGRRPSWVILNNVSDETEAIEETKEVVLPQAPSGTIVIKPKHADNGQFYYWYKDKDCPRKELSSEEIVKVAERFGFQKEGMSNNVCAVFFLNNIVGKQNPEFKIKVQLSTYK